MSPTPSQARSATPSTPKLFWVILAVAVGLLALYLVKAGVLRSPSSAAAKPAAARAEAPAGSLRLVSDPSRNLALSSLKGRVVVLHFWATWCPPCRAEFPKFAQFAASTKADDPWVVVPVSIDDSTEPVGPFLNKLPERFPVYWDEGGVLANSLQVSAIPTTIVLDKNGKVASQDLGVADWSARGIPAMVKALSHE
jgi:thiol-disulfide isomerase/thioredoxin